ncbi:hypothetical protein IGL98_003417 [Enterococcus sp. DIV0840]|uniref:LPXTG cell wall anchor domain-containing protein n=1 Tax=Enterococcus TaxID=1350 RepID=UPI001A8D3838|nr:MULTISPECIES: LPXTG cell wall anchor domain-containing protein [Enterococcus]MBO0473881.1 LPXTG cell wall anchor domain-containing protein [Enterococcus ureasiticus]
MSKLVKATIGFMFVCLAFSVSSNTYALEQEYESNGETSFYGKYEYNTEEDKEENKDSSSINVGKNTGDASNHGTENTGSNNYSATGQNILPNTGDFINPLYSIMGISTFLGMVILIYMFKRKEEF